MFKVQMEKECGCFRKSEYEKEKTFDNRDDALLYSQALVELMTEEFCKKHAFSVREVDRENFMIHVGNMPSGSGCCGGGHCG